ncbi:MAG: beta-mannanase [Anaerolineales bacterium]|nr:MAG: beta-mannanase [Anaerolineales bacterium]
MLSLTEPGKFIVGCNYWASHAGTAMWSDWRPEVVEADLRQLAEGGLQVLRVFPLWPDFQPLTYLYTGHGRIQELRMGETPLAHDEAGAAGVSPQMMQRFADFADMAEKYELRLLVGLVTGWMSGRLFVPPAFEKVNVLTDPVAIKWQSRFVRYFVRRFKTHAAILAWDLGNECNVMGAVPSNEAAWVWTSAIVNSIRIEDKSRPIVSGMHSLEPRRDAPWRIQDQAELTDVLTTHPYPIFTPHCDNDPVNTIRGCLHATAESRYYADIGAKPCIAEELGTLGPMISSEEVAADYLRTVLFSLWAHDCHGLLWWCGYDQDHLTHAPYDWHSHERELGLVRKDRSPKPVFEVLGQFGDFIKQLPIPALPPRLVEAVCILTHDQDQWAAAFSSFILAKQAGFDVGFQYADEPLKQSALYLIPSASGSYSFSRRFWLELDQRVRDGATLYLSHDDCMLSPFNLPFGIAVQTRERRTRDVHIAYDNRTELPSYTVQSSVKLQLKATHAQVLGCEPDGNPAFTLASHGKGQVYFLSVPVEKILSNTSEGYHHPHAQAFWKLYRYIAHPFMSERALSKEHPFVGITEHPLDDAQRVAVLINYSPEPIETLVKVEQGWSVAETWYGKAPEGKGKGLKCYIDMNSAVVLRLARSTHTR